LTAATWASTASRGQLLYADRYGQLRLWASSGAFAFTAVTPKTLDRDAWVFGTRTNVLLERARGMIGNYYAVYRWPDGFLGAHFDTVYSDGDSRVYHGVGR